MRPGSFRVLTAALAGLLLPMTLVAAPADAVVDPSVTPDAKAILEGDLVDYQWMLAAVNAPQAWTESTGAGV
ncbi:MAG: hypothetical protein OEW41_08125, partial [Actinomycetota bacterium]|nr:hypothetical protein [Actinomycetota bacterium]